MTDDGQDRSAGAAFAGENRRYSSISPSATSAANCTPPSSSLSAPIRWRTALSSFIFPRVHAAQRLIFLSLSESDSMRTGTACLPILDRARAAPSRTYLASSFRTKTRGPMAFASFISPRAFAAPHLTPQSLSFSAAVRASTAFLSRSALRGSSPPLP